MTQDWAITIGINEYENLPNLSYAQRDAELMQNYFLREAGFEQVYLFTDNSPKITDAGKPYKSQPTYGTLKHFLRERFDNPFLSTGDNLWFFFSGHGLRYEDRDYLILSDTDSHPEGIENTAISFNYLTERLRRCGADNIILVLDACRNEQMSKGLGIGEKQHQGIITIASCSPTERAFEIKQLQQSSFTYALLESLRIQGEGNCATVERLYQRVRYRVAEINLRYKKPRQTPYAVVEPASKYHLILLPRQATENDIAILREDAQEAEIEGKLELAEQLWTRVLAVSPANPKALKALKRIWSKQEEVQSNPGTSEEEKPQAKLHEVVSESTLQVFNFQVITVNQEGTIVNEQPKSAQYFTEDLSNGVTLDMVYIPGGQFLMGTKEEEIERLCRQYKVKYFRWEKPQHEVTVQPFFMGKLPVTQAQWRSIASREDLKVKRELDTNPAFFQDREDSDRCPVEQISWDDAVEFCQRLSQQTGKKYRLPSEAEWEYACRAGTTTPFHFGETITDKLANYLASTTYASELPGNNRKQTHPVGSFPPNAFGLYDMHGNVWEWCTDVWHDSYEGAPIDGNPWLSKENHTRVIRGGCWYYNPLSCRSAYRDDTSRGYRFHIIGFRVVCVTPRNK